MLVRRYAGSTKCSHAYYTVYNILCFVGISCLFVQLVGLWKASDGRTNRCDTYVFFVM